MFKFYHYFFFYQLHHLLCAPWDFFFFFCRKEDTVLYLYSRFPPFFAFKSKFFRISHSNVQHISLSCLVNIQIDNATLRAFYIQISGFILSALLRRLLAWSQSRLSVNVCWIGDVCRWSSCLHTCIMIWTSGCLWMFFVSLRCISGISLWSAKAPCENGFGLCPGFIIVV